MTALPLGEPWVDRALCAQTDPEAFFPEKGGSTREAKKVCTSCEVREECLAHALANDERFGIAGGLSERERRKLKREQAELAQTGTDATVPTAATTNTDTEAPEPPRTYGLPYVGAANSGSHYPLPSPDKPVRIEQRATRAPSIDWDAIRAQHEDRRKAEGTLDQAPTPPAPQRRCRWCRRPAEDLVDDVCDTCRHDAAQQFTVPTTHTAEPSCVDSTTNVDSLISSPAGDAQPTSSTPASPRTKAPTTRSATSSPSNSASAPTTSSESSTPDIVAYCEHLLRDTATSREPLVQILRNNALSALAALDLVANPDPAPVAASTPTTDTGTTKKPRTPRRRGPDLDPREIADRYEAGESAPELARAYGVGPKRIRNILDQLGIARRDDRATNSGGRNKRAYPDELVAAIRTRYVDHGMTQAQVAADLDISTKVVQNVMARHHITPRPPASHPGTQTGVDRARGLKERIADLGVTSRDIKTWALAQGLITEIKRGVCHTSLVDAYELAHPATPTPEEHTA